MIGIDLYADAAIGIIGAVWQTSILRTILVAIVTLFTPGKDTVSTSGVADHGYSGVAVVSWLNLATLRAEIASYTIHLSLVALLTSNQNAISAD